MRRWIRRQLERLITLLDMEGVAYKLGGAAGIEATVDRTAPLVDVCRSMLQLSGQQLTDGKNVVSRPLTPGEYVIELKWDITIRRKA